MKSVLDAKYRATTALVAGLLFLVAAAPGARAAACAASITACGCTITTGGGIATPFTIANNLTFTATSGACIVIAAANAALNGNGKTITGPGTSTGTIGIHLLHTAKASAVENVGVTNFGQGVRAEDRNYILLGVEAITNGKGIVLLGPNGLLDFSGAEGNQIAGVQINATGSDALLGEVASNNNLGAGIRLNGATGVRLVDITASGNSTFGIWFNGASSNTLGLFTAADNTIAGVYLGCKPTGPGGAACPAGALPSNGNAISNLNLGTSSSNSDVSPSSSAKQKYGVAIDIGNVRNQVLDVTGTGNGTADGIDENPSCASNFWLTHGTLTVFQPTSTGLNCNTLF